MYFDIRLLDIAVSQILRTIPKRTKEAILFVKTILKPHAYSLNNPQTPDGFFLIASFLSISPDNLTYFGSDYYFSSSSAFILIGFGGSLINIKPIIGETIPNAPQIIKDVLHPTALITGRVTNVRISAKVPRI